MPPQYRYNHLFLRATDRAKGTVQHENNPPDQADWGGQDDTLTRQGGHGICKGLATAWVIAFLNGVEGASDLDQFPAYFLNVLKFQGTYIKDYGKHIDSHLIQMAKFGFRSGLRRIKEIKPTSLRASDLVGYNWGCYASVWKHDVAFGRRSGKFYIMEPNFGLFRYQDQSTFLLDANELIEARRARKHKGPNDSVGLWFYGKS